MPKMFVGTGDNNVTEIGADGKIFLRVHPNGLIEPTADADASQIGSPALGVTVEATAPETDHSTLTVTVTNLPAGKEAEVRIGMQKADESFATLTADVDTGVLVSTGVFMTDGGVLELDLTDPEVGPVTPIAFVAGVAHAGAVIPWPEPE